MRDFRKKQRTINIMMRMQDYFDCIRDDIRVNKIKRKFPELSNIYIAFCLKIFAYAGAIRKVDVVNKQNKYVLVRKLSRDEIDRAMIEYWNTIRRRRNETNN